MASEMDLAVGLQADGPLSELEKSMFPAAPKTDLVSDQMITLSADCHCEGSIWGISILRRVQGAFFCS